MALTIIRKLPIESEANLEQLLSECPAAIEPGIQILGRQVPAGRGFIDILAVDADNENALVVIELKKGTDDHVLVQALEYYDFVRENIERVAHVYPGRHINVQVEPRILLVAGGFSAAVLAGVRYLDVPVSLYTYAYLGLGDKKGLYLTEVPVSPRREFKPGRLSVEEHMAWITDSAAYEACRQVLQWLQQLDPAIQTSGIKSGISVKFRGKNFAGISTKHLWFDISWRPEWEHQRIAALDAFTQEMKGQLRQCLADMGAGSLDVGDASS